MHAAPDGPALVARVQAATAVFLTHATANGIQPAFGPDKTAALLPPAVVFDASLGGSDSEGASWLPILDGITGAVQRLLWFKRTSISAGLLLVARLLSPSCIADIPKRPGAFGPSRDLSLGTLVFPSPHVGTSCGPLLCPSLPSALLLSNFTCRDTGGCGRAFNTALWRALQPRTVSVQRAHSFAVLHLAQAVTPPLALARARAGLLLRIVEHGPATLRHLLFLQWEADASRSWLGMLQHDIRHVALYCPAAGLLLEEPSPVRALIAAVQADRSWWKRQICAAERLCLQDLQAWHDRQSVPLSKTASCSSCA